MVAWPKVTRLIELGGLGVPDLAMLGHVLCLQWAWLARIDPSRSWSALPNKGDKIEQALFEASTSVVVGFGKDTWFWRDKWIEGQSIASLAPDLLVAVHRRALRVRTVAHALQNDHWVVDITGSLSALGLQQYLALWERIHAFDRVESAPDRFCWKWTTSSQYSASSVMYRVFFIGQTGVLGAKELQKTIAPPICKFFVWLALLGRCWTSESLQHHSLPNSGACTLYSQSDEVLSHLLLTCVYSREVWTCCLQACDLQHLQPGVDEELSLWWLRCRKRIDKVVILHTD
jgi:hypothetical protein